MTLLPRTTLEFAPALILFGNDYVSRPHAGWFTADELITAERASGSQGYAALRVTNVEERDLALMLPHGRLVGPRQVLVPLLSPALVQVLRLLVVGNRLVRLRSVYQREREPDRHSHAPWSAQT